MSSLTSPRGEPERLATGRIAEDQLEHMKPRVTLRKALEDPELLGSALAEPAWHACRSHLRGSD